MTHITATHVTKIAGDTMILSDVSFHVAAGSYVGIIGPNGAGKTTLLKILLGLDTPTRGTVTIAPGVRVGYVPQHCTLPPHVPISVQEVVMMGVSRGKRDAVTTALRDVGLPATLCRHNFHTLSGGQKQRVLIARAVAAMPDILCVDEPLSGVDHASRERISDFLATLNASYGTTIIFISHDIARITQNADTVLCLDKTLHTGCHPMTFATQGTVSCPKDDGATSPCAACTPVHHHH